MLVISKVFQRLKHRTEVVEAIKHIGKDNHKAAAMGYLGNLMQALGCRGGLSVVFVVVVNQLLQLAIDKFVVNHR